VTSEPPVATATELASPTPGAATLGSAAADPLVALRTELEERVDALPVSARVGRFEHANEVLAAELALLDEV
jgi:hypothetical protein